MDQGILCIDHRLHFALFHIPDDRISIERHKQRGLVTVNDFRRIHIQFFRSALFILYRFERCKELVQRKRHIRLLRLLTGHLF